MEEKFIIRFDQTNNSLDVLEKYVVNDKVQVTITKDGRYYIKEPELSTELEKLYGQIMSEIRRSTPTEAIYEDTVGEFKKIIEQKARDLKQFNLYFKEKDALEYYMIRNLKGFNILDPLINDHRIEDIIIPKWNGDIIVKHRDYTQFWSMPTNVRFESEQNMAWFLNTIADKYGKRPTDIAPSSSFTTGKQVRWKITSNDIISPDGPSCYIRIPSKNPITLYHLLKSKMLSPLAAAYLWVLLDLKGFLLPIGSTGSGKTTFLNALTDFFHPRDHPFVIDDVQEVRITHANLSRRQVSENSSLQDSTSKHSVSIFGLLKDALRSRPSFVIVGEVLGKEVQEIFAIAQSGVGVMTTYHALSPADAIFKLQSSSFGVEKEQTRSISCIIHLAEVIRNGRRTRIVTRIGEPYIYDQKDFSKKIRVIFKDDPEKGELVLNEKHSTSSINDEIDILLETSSLIKNAKLVFGIDNLKQDMQRRVEIVQSILTDEAITPESVSKKISSYYEIH